MGVFDVLIVGAGPAGLATAIAAKKKGLSAVIVERGTVVNTILRFPTNMIFFTTPELLEIGGLPFVTPYDKPTRLEALRYYRRVVDTYELDIQMSEEVQGVTRAAEGADDNGHAYADGDGDAHVFVVTSRAKDGSLRERRARTVVLATGAFDLPNSVNVPGEELPHVSHYYDEAHAYYRKHVVIVGAQNSAADTALDLYRSGAKSVTLVHRGAELGRGIKYWVRPDIENRIKEGSVKARFNSRVVRITPDAVTIEPVNSGSGDGHAAGGAKARTEDLPADAVFLLTGYHADVKLFHAAGVEYGTDSYAPVYNESTFETNVPGMYVVGNATTGNQTGKIFIENGRFHGTHVVEVIADRLAARAGRRAAHASELG
jgi:thioredoxin reductase (NADPH)